LHARGGRRAEAAAAAVPGASGVAVGDLASLDEIRALAADVAARGPFDAIIHNAGVLESDARERTVTVDGLELTWAVNVVAPYLLTALLPRPARLVFLSSQMHQSGRPDLGDLQWARRGFRGSQAYSDSKLAVTALAFAVAARHPDVLSNAVDPGWVRSRMGGAGAPVSLAAGAATPVRLATSDDPSVRVTARYFTGGQARPAHSAAADPAFQEAILDACAEITGVKLP